MDLQEDASGVIRLGVSVLGALVIPLWAIIAASALYLVPGLGGDWYLDPLTNDLSFEYHPWPTLLFRGGSVGAAALAMASPLLVGVFIAMTGAAAFGRQRGRAAGRAYQAAAGLVELDVPLVVRKRRKGGQATEAIAIHVASASPLRRALARGIDLGLLWFSCIGAALVVVVLYDTQGEALDLRMPVILTGFAVGGLFVVQWVAAWFRGQTLGKIVLEIRTAADEGVESRLRSVLLRAPVWDLLGVAVGLGFAELLPRAVWALASMTSDNAVFVWGPFVLAVGLVSWPMGLVVVDLLRAMPLFFDSPKGIHDWVAGTGVVRTAVGAQPTQAAPIGTRVVARLIDGLLVATVAVPAITLGPLVGALVGVQAVGWLVSGLGLVLAQGITLWQWWSLASDGTTLGKRMVGLKIIGIDGELGFVRLVLVREILALGGISLVLPVLGTILDAGAALGEERRAIHDHLAGTRVVSSRSG